MIPDYWPPQIVAFYNRLTKVYKHLSKTARKKNITCFRIYDKDLPENPLVIDYYQGDVVVYEYESNHKLTEEAYDLWLDDCLHVIELVLEVNPKNIHLKVRKRKKDRLDQYQKTGEAAKYTIVQEGGNSFYVNFTDFLDTGLFLDHRLTRQMVAITSLGKNVLNLFSYTSSFSIYAAKGGAREVWSLDLSNTYIQWSINNSALNNCEKTTKMVFKKCDVLAEIPNLPKAKFDIIIADPPTFSNSKSMDSFWDVQMHHADMLTNLHSNLKDNGIIYFSTNATKFELDTVLENYFTIKNITTATTDFDFTGKLRRYCWEMIKKNDI